jgi:hypothetical protein
MPFATATIVTNSGRAISARRHLGATPAQAEPAFIGIGVGAVAADRTADATDTALSPPVETPRVAGASSVVTGTVANDTYQTVATITATAVRTVNEAGTFDAAAAGNMDISATFGVVTLQVGDSLQLTFRKRFA